MTTSPSRAALALCALALLLGAAWFLWPGAAGSPEAGGAGGAARGGAPDGASAGGPGGGARGGPGGGRSRESLVVVRTVEEGVSGDRLRALGDGEAVASVSVVPRGDGVIVAVAVGAGARVAAGDVLVRLDAEAETIARDLAGRAVADAEATRERQAQLSRSQAGIQAELDAADNALARARLALRDAELTLARRVVRAPIDGTVGIVAVGRGERVTSDTDILTIDDRTTLRVDFRVPERFASRVRVGQAIEATSFALPGRALDGRVSAIGSRVERDSRTLAVQATIDNGDDALRPGMSFSVVLRFAGERLPALDPLAIQWDSNGAFVWRVIDGKAVRTPVRIVQRNPESVLVTGALAPGEEVVTEGVLSLRDGAAVRVAGARRGAPADAGERAGEGGRPRSDSSGGA